MKEYRALTGISYRDDNGAAVSLDRGDPLPSAVVDKAPWLLEDTPGRGAAAEVIGGDHDFTIHDGPTAETKED